jgi:hypothetical protein
MSLHHNLQPFSPQEDASLHPTQGAPLPTTSSPGAQRASRSSNDVYTLLFTHPTPIPWQTFQNGRTWMPGQPMGAGLTLMMEDWALNPDIGITSLYTQSWSDPRAARGNHHPSGLPLGMSTVEHRRVSSSAKGKDKAASRLTPSQSLPRSRLLSGPASQ